MPTANLGNVPSWNLSDLYNSTSSKDLKNDLETVNKKAKKFQDTYKGKVKSLEAANLLKAIREYERIEELLGKLISYAYLVYAQNISDSKNSSFYQNISEKVNQYSTDILFFTLELNKIPNKSLDEKLTDQKLSLYKPWIDNVRAIRNYQLSDDIEQLLHEKSLTSRHSWHRLFEETLSGLRFDYKKKKLTLTEVMDGLSSKREETRKASAKSIGQTLKNNINIFALITNVLAKDKSIDDKWRGFARPISSRNLDNLVEDEVVDSLIKTVKKNYKNTSHKYYAYKAKLFGKKQLNYWDRNAPLPGESSRAIKWEEAVDIVLSAYNQFSPEMHDLGKQFFDKKWIDAKVVDGKDSGAFSHPTVPSVHPYILMNYQGKTRDVMTLAHELGHGVHQLLSASQGALMADTPLTLAETASVFGEQLTFRSFLNSEKNKKKRSIMIANKIEDMLNTLVRQIAFCEFERIIHDERKKGEIKTDKICDIWMDVQSTSLGPSIKLHEEYKYYWAYIPHFIHTPFYVYSYAFGDCLVNSLYKVFEQQPDGFQKKYLAMLKAGGILRHKELLQPFGLDASKGEFWQKGIDVISEFIDELS